MTTLSKTLADGTVVTIESNGGRYVQLRFQRGKVIRSLNVTPEEAEALIELFERRDR